MTLHQAEWIQAFWNDFSELHVSAYLHFSTYYNNEWAFECRFSYYTPVSFRYVCCVSWFFLQRKVKSMSQSSLFYNLFSFRLLVNVKDKCPLERLFWKNNNTYFLYFSAFIYSASIKLGICFVCKCTPICKEKPNYNCCWFF